MTADTVPVIIAITAVEKYIQTGEYLDYQGYLPKDLRRKSGVFVCIKIEDQLRGCIGTIEPVTESIKDEIVRNAVASAIDDPRFPPVGAEDFKYLSFSVDILGPKEKVDSLDELDPKRYGIIVSNQETRGLLLPDLDGVEQPRQQIEIALEKAGISKGTDFDIHRFEVKRFV